MMYIPARKLAPNRCLVVCACALILAALPASAQEFPTRTVRFIAPFAAGGGTDINTRRLADRLNKFWKQPVVVENLPGGGAM